MKRERMTVGTKALAAAAMATLGSQVAMAQLNFTGTSYGQDFDTLATSGTANTWANNSTLPGWYATWQNGTGSFPNTYVADAGTSNSGTFHSYGAVGSTERALGSVGSNTTGSLLYGVNLKNASLTDKITSFSVGYTGEQWRNGGNTSAQSLSLSYSLDATNLTDGSWVNVPGLLFNGPVASATAGALDGNASANRVVFSLTELANSLSIMPGQTFWIRFTDANDVGNDHGLAVDDFNLTVTREALPPPSTRTLSWKGNASAIWDAATANWLDGATAATWSDSSPDNAVFGTAGAAQTSVTVSGTRTVGTITFDAAGPVYTLGGGSLTLKGVLGSAIVAGQSANIGSAVTIDAAQTWDVASGKTLAASGVVSGATLTKTGAGVLMLSNAGNNFNGLTIQGGSVQFSADGQLGTGNVSLDGGTLDVTASSTLSRPVVGVSGGTIDTRGNTLTMSSALGGAGTITKVGSGTLVASGTGGAFTGTVALNEGTIRVTAVDGGGTSGVGVGTVNAGSGTTFEIAGVNLGTSSGTTAPNLNMDNGSTLKVSGTSSYGRSNGFKLVNGTSTQQNVVDLVTTNASDVFTFKNSVRHTVANVNDSFATLRVGGPGKVVLESGGVSSGSEFSGDWELDSGTLQAGPVASGGFGEPLNAFGFKNTDAKRANPIKVVGGVLAGAVNAPNPSSSAAATTPSFFRSGVTLAGGALASTNGVDANWGGDFATQAATTSSVLVYDPANPSQARNVNLVAGAAGANNNASGLSWGGTLVVNPGTLTPGGAFSINRDGGTVAVTPGASIQVLANATLNLGGSADALYDGTANAVAIANAGTFNVTAGAKTVGPITGTGTTSVTGGATLAIKAGSATSIQSAVAIDGSSQLDLNNNKLAINYTGSTIADTVRGQLQSGLGGGTWDGTTGITTSSGKNDANHVTAIGYAEASLVVGISPAMSPWAGVGVDASTLLLKYTYFGDANLDGKVDGSDYTLLDRGFNKHVSNAHWTDGDFNYDGAVTTADYFLADTAFGHQSGGVLSPQFLADRAAAFGDAYVASLIAAVPEPMSLGLVGVAAAGLLGRRRRAAK